jgi:hypothetical protein
VCAVEKNIASNCAGARKTPRSSAAWKNRAWAAVSDRFASAKFVTGPGVKKSVPIDPIRFQQTFAAAPAESISSRIRRSNSAAFASSAAYGGSFARTSSIAIPALIASGLPERVPAWYIGPAGATSCRISFRPP